MVRTHHLGGNGGESDAESNHEHEHAVTDHVAPNGSTFESLYERRFGKSTYEETTRRAAAPRTCLRTPGSVRRSSPSPHRPPVRARWSCPRRGAVHRPHPPELPDNLSLLFDDPVAAWGAPFEDREHPFAERRFVEEQLLCLLREAQVGGD